MSRCEPGSCESCDREYGTASAEQQRQERHHDVLLVVLSETLGAALAHPAGSDLDIREHIKVARDAADFAYPPPTETR